jgi:cytochrome c oxidase subunit 2
VSQRLAGLAAVTLLLSACSGDGPQTTLDPQGPLAREIDDLWQLVFIIATVVFILVEAVLVISIIRFRERKDDDRQPKQSHGNTRLEIMWTIVPAVLLAVLAVPTVQGIFTVRTPATGPDVLDVKVIGHQWWWEFEYPGILDAEGNTLTTANELHIPAGRPVNLTMTAVDVIHSFWVPPLQGKRDVVPGRLSTLTIEADPEVADTDYGFGDGVLPGQCAEFCGLAHADMRLRVFVHDDDGFLAWTDEQLQPAVVPESGVAADGFATFNSVCTACHQATVQQPDGTVETIGETNTLTVDDITFSAALAPDLTHFGSRTTFGGASFENTPEHLASWIDNPSAMKPMEPDRNDIPAGRILGMPDFGLSTEEIDSLVTMLEEWQ